MNAVLSDGMAVEVANALWHRRHESVWRRCILDFWDISIWKR